MADFRLTGDHLRRRYNSAVQVTVNQYGSGFTAAHTQFRHASKNDLVYLEDSPDYCIRDQESGKRRRVGQTSPHRTTNPLQAYDLKGFPV